MQNRYARGKIHPKIVLNYGTNSDIRVYNWRFLSHGGFFCPKDPEQKKTTLWHSLFSLVLAEVLFLSPNIIDYNCKYALFYMVSAFSSILLAFIAIFLHTVKHFSWINAITILFLFILLIVSCLEKFVFNLPYYETTYLTLVSPTATGLVVNIFFQTSTE